MNILVTDSEQANAIERVCDKRYLRGAGINKIVRYLDGLYSRNKNNDVRLNIQKLKSYWIARQG